MTLEEKLHKELDWLEIKHIDADGIIRNILSICQQEIDEACKKAKIEVYQECSEKAIEYQYGKLGGLAMTLFLQDRIKELKGE